MHIEPLTTLNWAYRLHYYICFRTHRRKAAFADTDRSSALQKLLSTACEQHDYHLLKEKVYPDHIRCLLSLRPNQTLSTVIKNLKGSVSHDFGSAFGRPAPLWARGFLARSVGRVRIEAVRAYLDHQSEHHGYASRIHPPIFRYRAKEKVTLTGAHSSFDLNHHLVLASRYRRGVFGSQSGEALLNYWLRVASKKGFAIDRASVLPDHVHLIVRIVPKLSIEAVALALMNNAQHWSGKHFPELMKGADQLWQPSAYAGTCGEVTTAMVKSFLDSRIDLDSR